MLRLALLLAWMAGAGPGGPAPAITVSAAISLSDVMGDLGRAYAAGGGGDVRFNFAGSNVLARQIALGAPVDLFVSADAEQMAVVAEAGRIAGGGPVNLVANRLAVVAASPDLVLRQAADLAGPRVRRIALGDPAAVPAGVYARRYLDAIGVWRRIAGKVVPVGNVRAALAAVESASADAAIVYATDLTGGSRARLAFVVTDPRAPAILYPAAVTARTAAGADAARRFLRFLEGEEAAAIFRRYGFETLTAASHP